MSILGYLIPSFIALFFLHKKLHVNFEETIRRLITIFEGTILMIGVLYVARFILPFATSGRIESLFILILYTVIGGSCYFLFMRYNRVVEKIFGTDFKKKKRNKIVRKG